MNEIMGDSPFALLASYFTLAGNVVPTSGNTVSPFLFRDRVEAAAKAGFRGFGFFDTDLLVVAARHGVDFVRAILLDNGMDHIECELQSTPWHTGADGLSRHAETLERFFGIAGAIGSFHVKVGGSMDLRLSLDPMIEAFAGLCDCARRAGTRVSLEMVPFTNVPDLATTTAIIDGSGKANAGYMLDSWHLFRGTNSVDDIAALPGDRIFGVELDDAAPKIRGTLLEDTLHHRLFCGEGAFDLDAFICAVDQTGYRGPFGIELLSDRLRQMVLQDAADRAFTTTAAAMEQARRSRSGIHLA